MIVNGQATAKGKIRKSAAGKRTLEFPIGFFILFF